MPGGYRDTVTRGWAAPFEALVGNAQAALTKVLSLAPNHALAQHILGAIYIWTNRAAEGIARCEHALALDRNLVQVHSRIGMAKVFIGRAEEPESHVLEALRLSPRDTEAYNWMLNVGIAKVFLGRDEEAAVWLLRSIEANRNHPVSHFYLAAARAHLGKMSEAQAAAKAGLAINPTFTIRRLRVSAFSDNRPISRNASASMMACARPGCRRGERSAIFAPERRDEAGARLLQRVNRHRWHSAPGSLQVRSGLKADVCRQGDKLKWLRGRARRYVRVCHPGAIVQYRGRKRHKRSTSDCSRNGQEKPRLFRG
jgi:tetratricopeptide (TPR) repeat protein